MFTDLSSRPGRRSRSLCELPEAGSHTVVGSVYFHDPLTNTNVPIQGAVAFIEGPGVYAYTDAAGQYRIEGVPSQGNEGPWSVHAIDYTRKLEGTVNLGAIYDTVDQAEPIGAQPIVLQVMKGGIDGVVLDPLGRPLANAEVVDFPYGTRTSNGDGSFSLSDLPLGGHTLVAHVGDGLQTGMLGYFGQATTSIVYGGHRPFVTIRMVGGGHVTVHTTTASMSPDAGVISQIYYKPTHYSDSEYRIRVQGAYMEASTDENGNFDVDLPVGDYELVAYNGFNGMKTIQGHVDYPGQLIHHEIVYENAASVTGQVVNVDGVTPVPDVEVVLEANGIQGAEPAHRARWSFPLRTGAAGPCHGDGSRSVAGSVERVGRTLGYVGTPGQTLDLTVQMKAQGTVTGRVIGASTGSVSPIGNARIALQEDSFPFRRLPGGRVGCTPTIEGRYEVPTSMRAGDGDRG